MGRRSALTPPTRQNGFNGVRGRMGCMRDHREISLKTGVSEDKAVVAGALRQALKDRRWTLNAELTIRKVAGGRSDNAWSKRQSLPAKLLERLYAVIRTTTPGQGGPHLPSIGPSVLSGAIPGADFCRQLLFRTHPPLRSTPLPPSPRLRRAGERGFRNRAGAYPVFGFRTSVKLALPKSRPLGRRPA
jgi:hypothetical protein